MLQHSHTLLEIGEESQRGAGSIVLQEVNLHRRRKEEVEVREWSSERWVREGEEQESKLLNVMMLWLRINKNGSLSHLFFCTENAVF